MVLLHIDKNKDQPLFQQIINQIICLIDDGALVVGDKLPSTRKMSEMLDVHRTTVCRAYDELWAAGYIESKLGGYSKVRERNNMIPQNAFLNSSSIDWNSRFSDASNNIDSVLHVSSYGQCDNLDFRPLSPDSDLMPVADFKRCLNIVLQNEGSILMDYSPSLGYYPLRQYLAKQMQQHGISASVDEILITNGIQNGLELLLRVLTNPGDCVFAESPTYSKALSLFNYVGITVKGIPLTKEGMNIELLEQEIKKQVPKFIYSIPTFHNPTGITSSRSHRERLLNICEKYKIPLIEDGFEEDMKYFGKAVLPIKSMDAKQVVIYLGTFSKVLFPGIRVGWMVAPKVLINKIGAVKSVCDLSGVALVQAALVKYCKQGLYDLHKKRMHRAFRKRMSFTLQACRKYLPLELVDYSKPDGGFLIWFTLKNLSISEELLIQKLKDAGVLVSPGEQFYMDDQHQSGFRLSISCRKDHEIDEGIRRIANVLKSLK